jgi:hypothetical protein
MKIGKYNIRVKISELTVGEFEDCYSIINDNSLTPIEKYLDVITYLIKSDGGDVKIIDEMTDDDFFKIIKAFSKTKSTPKFKNTLVIDGVEYTSYDKKEKFTLKARDLASIEKIFKNQDRFYSHLLAVLFKNGDDNHYTPENIKSRAEKIRSLNASDYFKYVILVSEKIQVKIQSLYDGPTE